MKLARFFLSSQKNSIQIFLSHIVVHTKCSNRRVTFSRALVSYSQSILYIFLFARLSLYTLCSLVARFRECAHGKYFLLLKDITSIFRKDI